ncbi:MAG: hypothetical protein PVI26_13945 [Chitinispirillia bacterium]|jgi:hypothetical protein
MEDPIVEKIRFYRDTHAKKFNYDLDAICEAFKNHQQQIGHPLVVKLKPKKYANKGMQRAPKRTVDA